MKNGEGCMNKLILTFFIFFFISCSTLSHIEMAKKIFIKKYACQVSRKDNLHFFSVNPLNNDRKINLSFFSYEQMSIEKVRMLLIESVENLILNANNDLMLKNCFKESDWNYEDINFDIMFLNKDGDFIENNKIAFVFLTEGIIKYAIKDLITSQLTSVLGESYFEAKGIVEHQKNLLNCEQLTGIPAANLFLE